VHTCLNDLYKWPLHVKYENASRLIIKTVQKTMRQTMELWSMCVCSENTSRHEGYETDCTYLQSFHEDQKRQTYQVPTKLSTEHCSSFFIHVLSLGRSACD